MDSPNIQDAFEPYYAGRDRVALPRDKRLPAKTDASLTKRAARGLPMSAVPPTIRLSDNEPQSMTEH